MWPNGSTPGYTHKVTQNTNSEEYTYLSVHCNIIYHCQDMEATQMPFIQWLDKKVVRYAHTHTHDGIFLSNKKDWNLNICNSMDGPRGYYAKWNKLFRERQIPYDLTYMWTLKNSINKQNRNRPIDTENMLMVVRGKGS